MPTTIYDSSLITQRRKAKAESESFINRIQNATNPSTGYAPRLGIYDQSIINTVKMGQMKEYRKNEGGCTTVNDGCPCGAGLSSNPVIESIRGWATKIGGGGADSGFGNATDSSGNVYITGRYDSSTLTINSFVSVIGGAITVAPYGTLSNSGSSDVYIVKYNTNGQALWATSIGGDNTDRGISIATDSSGNVYITGRYNSTPLTINSFDSVLGGVITTNAYGTLSNIDSYDVFIVKYNTNGQALWATNIGGSSDDYGYGIATDSSGNVYITGYYGQSISNPLTINSFDSVVGGAITVAPYGTLSNSGNNEAFIVKYNTSGQALWATNIGGSSDDVGYSVATDSSGNVYITGYYNSASLTINSFDSVVGGVITTNVYGTLSNIGSNDVFIVKYDTNGQALWATNIANISDDYGYGIATDSSGNVYITGSSISGLLTINSFDSVVGGVITTNAYGTLPYGSPSCVFIVKYDTNGQALWATNTSGSSYDEGNSITTDSSGNVYIIGYYNSAPLTINSFDSVGGGVITLTPYGALSNSGIYNTFIVKYDTNGQALWATKIGGGGADIGFSIATDSSGNVYITGRYDSSTLTINSFVSVIGGAITVAPYGTLSNSGSIDVFIVKYNTNGQV
jgi:hypothetical protein